MNSGHRQALLLALGLLTRLPVHRWLRSPLDGATQGLAAAYYPLVGLILGLVLWMAQRLLGSTPPMLAAFGLLTLWVVLTGALHLDGLADSVDGYFAGHKSGNLTERRERILAVMHEPACGAMAVVALLLVLLGKWVALTVLLQSNALSLFGWLLVPALPRAALLPYIRSFDYVRSGGIAATLTAHLPGRTLLGVTLACALLALMVWPLGLALWALALLALLTWAWRSLWLRSVGGFTGDCLGALVELAEVTLLLVLALALGAGSVT